MEKHGMALKWLVLGASSLALKVPQFQARTLRKVDEWRRKCWSA